MHLLVITNAGEGKGDEVLGSHTNWTGPIPRVGEYIYHRGGPNVMTVKTVTYKLFNADWTPCEEPFVEVFV